MRPLAGHDVEARNRAEHEERCVRTCPVCDVVEAQIVEALADEADSLPSSYLAYWAGMTYGVKQSGRNGELKHLTLCSDAELCRL